MKRLYSIDVVRGLVMIIMALDHTRDLFHVASLTQDPTNLKTTTPVLFFTRLITHFCAPTFVFLAGTSAYLSKQAMNDVARTKSFLIKRGLWLVVMEFTLINFALWADPKFRTFIFQVIAAIGFSFVILAFMLKWSNKALLATGLIIICGHDALALIPGIQQSVLAKVLGPLFVSMPIPLGFGRLMILAYPVIPWLGIMLVGYAAGTVFERKDGERRKSFLRLGLLLAAGFLVLRALNIYGDPVRWSQQKDAIYTGLSFLNVTKYPPSLAFTLLTLSGMFLALWVAERGYGLVSKTFEVYGKVPFLYYLVHWYVLHTMMFLMVFMQGFGIRDMSFGFNFGRPEKGSGLGLPGVYLVWVSVVVALYPLCKWYGKYKSEHREKQWLRYL